MKEQVNHPNHYNNHPSGVEAIEIVEHMTYNIGTAVAYLWRHQDKHTDPTVDLKKAIWHINKEIDRLKTLEKDKDTDEWAWHIDEPENSGEYRVVCLSVAPKVDTRFDTLAQAMLYAIRKSKYYLQRMEIESDTNALYGVTYNAAENRYTIYEYSEILP